MIEIYEGWSFKILFKVDYEDWFAKVDLVFLTDVSNGWFWKLFYIDCLVL